jgi:hypothetical protein
VWLLTSLNRPKECQLALDAFAEVGRSMGALWLDGDDYPDIRLPQGWFVHRGSGGLAEAFRWFFGKFHSLPWYGWLADDMRPVSKDFDKELIKTTEGKYFVYCNGGGHKTPLSPPEKPPQSIPGAMVWGGDLVREVGWWAPPWAKYSCIDEAWKLLALKAGVARYRHDVIVNHLHWGSRYREQDATDKIGMQRAQNDVGTVKDWVKSPDFMETVERIKRFTA